MRWFLRVLADCGESHFCYQPAGFTLRLRILSPTRPTRSRSKSERRACHPYINQRVTRGRINRFFCGIGKRAEIGWRTILIFLHSKTKCQLLDHASAGTKNTRFVPGPEYFSRDGEQGWVNQFKLFLFCRPVRTAKEFRFASFFSTGRSPGCCCTQLRLGFGALGFPLATGTEK